ncbi:major histocompatibility complex class I-related gene protein-like [Polymixia lowei]
MQKSQVNNQGLEIHTASPGIHGGKVGPVAARGDGSRRSGGDDDDDDDSNLSVVQPLVPLCRSAPSSALLQVSLFMITVTHTMIYFLTGSSEVPNIPEYVIVVMVDEVEVGYCDSNSKRAVPKQDWMKKSLTDDPHIWETNTGLCLYDQQRSKTDIDTLKQRFNQTGVHPSVSLLQKSPSSPVTCHATGFYPDRVKVFWRRDGEELHEHVDHGELLTNQDGTFQMSVHLDLSSMTPDDWKRFDCVVQLSGVKDDIITKLDQSVIRTNWKRDLTVPIIIIIIIIISVFILSVITVVIGVRMYKKKKVKRPTSPPDSELSDKLNPEG